MTERRAAVAATLLGVGEILRRQNQQLLDQRHSNLVHQLVGARLRPFEQLEHRRSAWPLPASPLNPKNRM